MTNQPVQPNPLDQERAAQDDKKKQNIYNASTGQIFSKNFVAGFARGLGMLAVYLIFITVLSVIISTVLLPKLQPMLGTFTQGLNPQMDPNQVQDLLNQMGK